MSQGLSRAWLQTTSREQKAASPRGCCPFTKSCRILCDSMDCSTPACFSLSPGACSDSCPLSHCCCLTISSSATPFSFGFQSSPTAGSLPISWLFASGDLSIGASTSDSVLPMNIQLISFRVDWFDLCAVQGTLESLPQQHNLKTSVLQHSAFLTVQPSHPYVITSKTIALTTRTYVSKVISLLFNTLSQLFFHGVSLLISWLQSPLAVILEPKKINCHCLLKAPLQHPEKKGRSAPGQLHRTLVGPMIACECK